MKRLASLILLGACFLASSVSALTVDEFNGGGLANSAIVDDVTTQSSKSIVSTSAVGGRRTVLLTRTDGPPGGSSSIYSNTKLYHSQGSGVRALSIVTWDGDADATNAVKGNGLGSIDLFQDAAATKFIIQVFSFDYANQTSADITLRLYDASSPNAQKYSDVTVTLDRVVSNFALEIPFSYFVDFGNKTIPAPFDGSKPLAEQSSFKTITAFALGNNKADLSRIGAIQFSINGQNGDSDLAIDFIRTDGSCLSVPDSVGDVLDECGFCSDNQNFKMPKDDCGLCADNPKYQASRDVCNVCSGDGTSCLDCAGVPNGGKVNDLCGICGGNGTQCLDCKGMPFGLSKLDPCNVCDGDGTSCLDCSGTANGSAVKDICGVCGGNGTQCLDCAGVPFGTAVKDSCGVCGGNGTSCLDCSGTPFGSNKVDACGTCGGTVTDAAACNPGPLCVTVQATSDILTFEKRLVTQAKTIKKKYVEEDKRGKRNGCGINTKPSTVRVNTAFETITAAGKDIFTKGVNICGDDCVTVSFAEQVIALAPTLKIIEKETKSLAKKVQSCYKKKKIKTAQGTAGVATTIKTLDKDLKQLIQDCKDKQVCPK